LHYDAAGNEQERREGEDGLCGTLLVEFKQVKKLFFDRDVWVEVCEQVTGVRTGCSNHDEDAEVGS
jgi:hypothetical protein